MKVAGHRGRVGHRRSDLRRPPRPRRRPGPAGPQRATGRGPAGAVRRRGRPRGDLAESRPVADAVARRGPARRGGARGRRPRARSGGRPALEDLTGQLPVNLVAPAELTRALLPGLRAARGTVVFLNSGAGLVAHPEWSAYAASKFGLRAIADSLRAEEAGAGVRVTSVYLGRIATPMHRRCTSRRARTTTRRTGCRRGRWPGRSCTCSTCRRTPRSRTSPSGRDLADRLVARGGERAGEGGEDQVHHGTAMAIMMPVTIESDGTEEPRAGSACPRLPGTNNSTISAAAYPASQMPSRPVPGSPRP